MKKLLVLTSIILAIFSAKAEDEWIEINHWIEGIYPLFTNNNEVYLFNTLLEEDRVSEEYDDVNFYDSSFNLIKSIKINRLPYSYKRVYESFVVTTVEMNPETNKRKVTGGYWKKDSDMDTEESGYVSALTEVDVSWIYGGGNSSGFSSTFTQNLFNKDDKFEYVSPITEESTRVNNYERNEVYIDGNYYDTDPYIGGRETITTNFAIGFKVVNEDGDILQTVMFENGYYYKSFSLHPIVIDLQGKKYLKFSFLINNDGEDVTLIYKINDSGAGIESVGAFKQSAKVSPRTMRRSELVNVVLEQPALRNCKINVVNLSGSIVMTRDINVGDSNVSIDTSSLQPGMYIVNVCDRQEIRENCKIIIR